MFSIVEVLRGILQNVLNVFNRKPKVSWREARVAEVFENLVGENGLLSDYPYIEGGTYHWKGLSTAVKLDLVFQELPLAVVITEEYYGNYDEVKRLVPSRHAWELYMKEESSRILSCRAAEFPLLMITPNDPIDIYTLSLEIDKLLSITTAGDSNEEE